MKRVIREVLPTGQRFLVSEEWIYWWSWSFRAPDCSPKKTSLNFFNGFVYEPTFCAMVAKVCGLVWWVVAIRRLLLYA